MGFLASDMYETSQDERNSRTCTQGTARAGPEAPATSPEATPVPAAQHHLCMPAPHQLIAQTPGRSLALARPTSLDISGVLV